MRKIFVSTGLILAISMIAPSAFSQDLTLADLKLGMTQAKVETTMVENGYVPHFRSGRKTNSQTALTFAQKVKQKQGQYFPRKTYEGLQSLAFAKDDREIVTVAFEQYPSGQFVTEISYVLNDKTMGPAQFKERVFAKYGKPTRSWLNPEKHIWDGDQAMSRDKIGSKETLRLNNRALYLKAQIATRDYQMALKNATPKSTGETNF